MATALTTPAADAAPALETSSSQRWWQRIGAAIVLPTRRSVVQACAIYLTVTGVAILTLASIAYARGVSLGTMLSKGDAEWYLELAANGYEDAIPYQADGTPAQSHLAFFPGLPALIRLVHELTGLNYLWSGAVVSLIAGLVAAVGIQVLVRSIVDERAGYVGVALWACAPAAGVQWIAYTEALATAFIVWTVIAMLVRRWLIVAVLACVSGLVRPTMVMLIAAVGLAALIAIVKRQDNWRPWVAVAVAPLGVVASWLIIGASAGQLDAWWIAQQADGWNQHFDMGVTTLQITRDLALLHLLHLSYLVSALTVIMAGVCIVALIADRRVPWIVIAVAVLFWILTIDTAGAYTSKARFLLPIMPLLLVPVASVLSRANRGFLIVLFAVTGMLTGWYAAYMFLSTVHAL